MLLRVATFEIVDKKKAIGVAALLGAGLAVTWMFGLWHHATSWLNWTVLRCGDRRAGRARPRGGLGDVRHRNLAARFHGAAVGLAIRAGDERHPLAHLAELRVRLRVPAPVDRPSRPRSATSAAAPVATCTDGLSPPGAGGPSSRPTSANASGHPRASTRAAQGRVFRGGGARRDRRRNHRLSFDDGDASHLDGARRMEARGWSVAGRRARRLGAARAPNLNPRMLPCAGRSHLNPRMFAVRRCRES